MPKEFELEDEKYYDFLGLIVKGSTLKKLKDDYFKHPPSQAELDKRWSAWEKETFKNTIIVSESLRLEIYPDKLIMRDIFGTTINTIKLLRKKVTNTHIRMVMKIAEEETEKRGEISLLNLKT